MVVTTSAALGVPAEAGGGPLSPGPGRADARPRRRAGVRQANVPVYVALIIGALASLSPILIVLVNSFRPNSEIVRDPLGVPATLDFSNYVNAWFSASLGTYFLNSVIVTAGALALCLVLALPVGYAIGRWTFAARTFLGVLFLAGLMVPLRIGVVPLARLYERLGLNDSLFGLILIYAAIGLPMAVLILSAFYAQLPDSLEDAALVDGAGHGILFLRIMTPLVRPAIAAVLVLNVGPAWNDFFMPLIFLRSFDSYTIPVGITTFFTEHSADRGLLFAGIIIAILPVAIFFSLAMKHVVRGLTAGIGK